MEKLIVAVAPVGSWGAGEGNPLSPEHVAEQVYGCWRLGASYVHLHVRDREGTLTEDLSVFHETLALIRARCDIIINASTGGASDLTPAQRCVALSEPWVETASLNMGSSNFGDGVYINSPSDIDFWAREMSARGVKPEFEIFEAGMVNNTLGLIEKGFVSAPYIYNFSLGFTGAMPATPKNLLFLSELLPAGAVWGFLGHGTQNMAMTAAAISFGASMVRCGFEDSRQIAPGRLAGDNLELVREVVMLAKSLGREIATADEARRILGLKPRS